MKFLSYRSRGVDSWGVMVGDAVVDLGSTQLPTLLAALQESDPQEVAGRESAAASRVPLADIELLPPIVAPGKVICVGLNYATHVDEMDRELPEYPVLFSRFNDTLVASSHALVKPVASEQLDFEGELAVVIGKGGRHIPATAAMEHVFGFSVFNDASVRDYQWHTHQWMPGKNFPGTGGFGPWIVPRADIPDLDALTLTTRVNGKAVQHTTIGAMLTRVPELLAYISQFTELSPGDVIATGTPSGVGARHVPPLWLKPGDVVEVEVSRIGVLVNEVVAEGAH